MPGCGSNHGLYPSLPKTAILYKANRFLYKVFALLRCFIYFSRYY